MIQFGKVRNYLNQEFEFYIREWFLNAYKVNNDIYKTGDFNDTKTKRGDGSLVINIREKYLENRRKYYDEYLADSYNVFLCNKELKYIKNVKDFLTNGKSQELILCDKLRNTIYEFIILSNIDDRVIKDMFYLVEKYESNSYYLENIFEFEKEYYYEFKKYDKNKKNVYKKYELKEKELKEILSCLSKEFNGNELNNGEKEKLLRCILKTNESIYKILSGCSYNGVGSGLERIDNIRTIQSLLIEDNNHVKKLIEALIFNILEDYYTGEIEICKNKGNSKDLLFISYEKNYLNKIRDTINNNSYEIFCVNEIIRSSIYSAAVIKNDKIPNDLLCLAIKMKEYPNETNNIFDDTIYYTKCLGDISLFLDYLN